jgi:lipopolysaccharide export system permease protein
MTAVETVRRVSPWRPSVMDIYLLRALVKPALACLGITFLAMLLEAMLRMINELTERGAHLGYLFGLITSLAPYYLGLALTASFLISMMMVVARLQDDGEIEAMLASGRSMTRIAAPFILVGLVLSLISILLLGFLQPYSRYGYRAVRNAVVNAGWTGQLQPQVFMSPGAGITITADESDPTGRRLQGVFVRRLDPMGVETMVTAEGGVLALGQDNATARLQLDQGLIMREDPNGSAQVFRFENVGGEESIGMATALQPRGENERELTLGELVREMATAQPVIPDNVLKAELYARIARSLVLPALPLIAFALGLAIKRGRRAPGLILAGVLLIALHHGVQLAKGFAVRGEASPEVAIGTVALLFGSFALWMFVGSLKRPGDTPLSRLLARLQSVYDRIARFRPKPHVQRGTTSVRAYLARLLIARTAAAWGVLIAVLQMIDLLERMGDLLQRGGVWALARYAVLMLPEMAQQTAGMAMLIGAVFTFMQLARSSEMVVMRATGISMYQIFKAALPVGLCVVIVHAVLADQLTPRSQEAFDRWWTETAPDAGTPDAEAQWFRIGNDIVQLGGASVSGETLQNLRIYQRDADKILSRRLTAPTATAEPGGGWRLHDSVMVNIEGDRGVTTQANEMFWQSPLRPDDAARLFADVPQISAREAFGSLTGSVPATQSRSRLITRLHRAFAEPLVALAMLLLALPLVLGHPRSDQTFPVLYAVIGGLLYLVVDGLLVAAGQAGALPPALASWAGPGIFVCLAVTVLLYADK